MWLCEEKHSSWGKLLQIGKKLNSNLMNIEKLKTLKFTGYWCWKMLLIDWSIPPLPLPSPFLASTKQWYCKLCLFLIGLMQGFFDVNLLDNRWKKKENNKSYLLIMLLKGIKSWAFNSTQSSTDIWRKLNWKESPQSAELEQWRTLCGHRRWVLLRAPPLFKSVVILK